MIRRIWYLFIARNREFYRDKAGLSWNLLFPVLLILGFAAAFSRGDKGVFKVAVYPPDAITDTAASPLLATSHIEFVPVSSISAARDKVRYHQFDMLIVVDSVARYEINAQSQKGYLLSRMAAELPSSLLSTVTGKAVRYVDWLAPGILAMNMMFSALFGVGWMIVRYRKTGYLRRLKATPVSALEFLVAQIISRMAVILVSSVIVFAGTHALVRFTMNGSYLLLLLVFAAGTFCMIALSLVIAARFSNEEMVNGVLNFLTWPMMFLSGVWFSLDGVHPVLQKISLAFPLTHMVNATRAVMLEGAGVQGVFPELALLFGLAALFLSAGVLLFRWE